MSDNYCVITSRRILCLRVYVIILMQLRYIFLFSYISNLNRFFLYKIRSSATRLQSPSLAGSMGLFGQDNDYTKLTITFTSHLVRKFHRRRVHFKFDTVPLKSNTRSYFDRVRLCRPIHDRPKSSSRMKFNRLNR